MKELEKEYEGSVSFKIIDISTDFESAQKYGVQGTPTILILDKAGAVVDTVVGPPEKADLKASLNKLLSK
ncbi:MAG: thioredoxin family protein [Actinobacteria bacterium]|nr:thioredoxin family protein [Actinomycetota bacterium]